jgi:hypothetical protein
MNQPHAEYQMLDGLVRKLEVQVGKLEAVLPILTAQSAIVEQHGEKLAGLAVWRDEHEKSDAARGRRYAGWSAGLGGLCGALVMKLLAWAQLHFTLLGIRVGLL